MEELLELKTLLTQGKVPDALALVEEMTEMSKDARYRTKNSQSCPKPLQDMHLRLIA